MMEEVRISNLNDFLFCPRSIYFHNLYERFDESLFHDSPQTAGRIAHESIDSRRFSTRTTWIQSIDVYSEELGVVGKIDLFDRDAGTLIERKKRIIRVYEGYYLQVYAQYYCLIEMGYTVRSIVLRSLEDNKSYDVPLPDESIFERIKELVEKMRLFSLKDSFSQSPAKCKSCIYRSLCDYYVDET